MSALLATTILAATIGAPAPMDLAQVYEDVRVVRRVATVAGQKLPSEVLNQLIDESVEKLRGRVDERNYAYASWRREEAGRETTTKTVKKEKDGRWTIVEAPAPSAYRIEISVPSRRLIAARNRPLELESLIADYTTAGGQRRTEQFDLARTMSPRESTFLDLAEFGWQVSVRLKSRAAAGAGGSGTLAVALLAPTLVDDPASPFAPPTAQLLAMRTAVRSSDILEIRRLSDATTSWFDTTSPRARSLVEPAGGASQMEEGITWNEKILTNLQQIETLLDGDDVQRREGIERLRRLIMILTL